MCWSFSCATHSELTLSSGHSPEIRKIITSCLHVIHGITTSPPCGSLCNIWRNSKLHLRFLSSLTCCTIVNMEALREVQASNLSLEHFDIFWIYCSGPCWKRGGFWINKVEILFNLFKPFGAKLTELQDVSTSDIPISKSVRPQQAARASLQNLSFVVWQILFENREFHY